MPIAATATMWFQSTRYSTTAGRRSLLSDAEDNSDEASAAVWDSPTEQVQYVHPHYDNDLGGSFHPVQDEDAYNEDKSVGGASSKEVFGGDSVLEEWYQNMENRTFDDYSPALNLVPQTAATTAGSGGITHHRSCNDSNNEHEQDLLPLSLSRNNSLGLQGLWEFMLGRTRSGGFLMGGDEPTPATTINNEKQKHTNNSLYRGVKPSSVLQFRPQRRRRCPPRAAASTSKPSKSGRTNNKPNQLPILLPIAPKGQKTRSIDNKKKRKKAATPPPLMETAAMDDWQQTFATFLQAPSHHLQIETGMPLPRTKMLVWGRQKLESGAWESGSPFFGVSSITDSSKSPSLSAKSKGSSVLHIPSIDLIRLDKEGTALWFPDVNQNARMALWIRDQRRAYQRVTMNNKSEHDATPYQPIGAVFSAQNTVDMNCNKRIKFTTTDANSDNTDTPEQLNGSGNDTQPCMSPLQQIIEHRYNLMQCHFRLNLLQLVGIDLTIDPDMTVVRKTGMKTPIAGMAQKSTLLMLPPKVTPATKPATPAKNIESTPKVSPSETSPEEQTATTSPTNSPK